ncbi:N-formylglutamate amidohydrolase [Patescibacteria group bacterium AH-259-L07]|nr:N-formylglutamate amidohydrolase [Patescibacteria group bacterium AH-259-L07]
MVLYNVLTKKQEELETVVIVDEPKENPTGESKIPYGVKKFVVCIPHCGIYIPEMCLPHLNIESERFFHDADVYTDMLFDLVDIGGVVIKTMINRDVVDPNRARTNDTKEGVIRSISFDKSKLIKHRYSPEERELLLKQFYDPFHRRLNKELETMRKKNGSVLLLNGHSMADQTPATRKKKEQRKRPDFCLGTQDGMSADQKILQVFEESLRTNAQKINATVERNYPFKGYTGITSRYARPSQGYHSIVLEVNKRLYLDENKKPRYDMIKKINTLIKTTMSETMKYF